MTQSSLRQLGASVAHKTELSSRRRRACAAASMMRSCSRSAVSRSAAPRSVLSFCMCFSACRCSEMQVRWRANLRASRTQQRSVTPGALLAKQEEWVCHRFQAGESTARKKSKAHITAEYEQARSRKHLAEAAFQPLHVFRMRGILQPR